MSDNTAPISVVFPYHNESATILKTISLISEQTLAPREVIFVNSSGTDNCSDIIQEWIDLNQDKFQTKFHNIFKGTNTPASSKNAGSDFATSEYIAFMDCGLLFEKTWIESQWKFIQKTGSKFVSGECIFEGSGVIDSCAIAQTYGYKRRRPTVPSTVIHRDVLNSDGKFLENRRAGYDAIWPTHLEANGFKRFVNHDVTIRYNGVNFASTLKAVFNKSKMYATPTVALPYYYIPYLYLLSLLVFLFLLIYEIKLFLVLSLLYVIARGFIIPVLKSKNLFIFKEYSLAGLFLPIVGVCMDAGKVIGIMLGVHKYHIRKLAES